MVLPVRILKYYRNWCVLCPFMEERDHFCCLHSFYNTNLNYYIREWYLYFRVLYLSQLKYFSVTFHCPSVCTCPEVGKCLVSLSPVYVLLLLSFVAYVDRLFSKLDCFDLFRCLGFRILFLYVFYSFFYSFPHLICIEGHLIWSFFLFLDGMWLITRYLCLSWIGFVFILFRILLLLLLFAIVSRNFYICFFYTYWMSYCFYYYVFWIIIAFDVFRSNFRAVGILGFFICFCIVVFTMFILQ